MEVRAIAADAPELSAALEAAQLPVEDIHEAGRSFFAIEDAGRGVGYGGFEIYGPDVLLRSIVVLPEHRGQGYGRAVTAALLAEAAKLGGRQAYLLTTTAERFFEREGFGIIGRDQAPASILSTRQATTICSTASLLSRPIANG
jgi:N-acetylglutamate synthase-like GNAT family acetyltransferase